MSQYQSGLAGEEQALSYLLAQGYQLQAKRVKTRHGELDLVLKKGGVLHFVEVKHRPQSRLGEGLAAITPLKRRRLLSAIQEYLADHPGRWQLGYLEITRAGIHYRADVLHGR